MSAKILRAASAVLFAFALTATSAAVGRAEDGIVKVKSAYPVGETIERLKQDIAAKGIMFFSEIDQSKLAANAGVALRPSTLLVFGNPPLGTLFLTSDPDAGLDWPGRLLVYQDAQGDVWVAYTDFAWIARRHGITNRDEIQDGVRGDFLHHVDGQAAVALTARPLRRARSGLRSPARRHRARLRSARRSGSCRAMRERRSPRRGASRRAVRRRSRGKARAR